MDRTSADVCGAMARTYAPYGQGKRHFRLDKMSGNCQGSQPGLFSGNHIIHHRRMLRQQFSPGINRESVAAFR